MSFTVVIPARYASTRLPGKPLLDIAGKPMIQHVVERARESGAQRVIVATDDVRIRTAVEEFGGEAILTAESHQSGTDRIAEVAEQCEFDASHIVVNLQGDEPLMPAENIHLVANVLEGYASADMSTACVKITSAEDLFNPNVVKVVRNRDSRAIYFSRATIPWDRDAFAQQAESIPETIRQFRHIGLYAYRVGFLQQYTQWPVCELERSESLEQLRVLWNGGNIYVAELETAPPPGVDTATDLEAVRAIL